MCSSDGFYAYSKPNFMEKCDVFSNTIFILNENIENKKSSEGENVFQMQITGKIQ